MAAASSSTATRSTATKRISRLAASRPRVTRFVRCSTVCSRRGDAGPRDHPPRYQAGEPRLNRFGSGPRAGGRLRTRLLPTRKRPRQDGPARTLAARPYEQRGGRCEGGRSVLHSSRSSGLHLRSRCSSDSIVSGPRNEAKEAALITRRVLGMAGLRGALLRGGASVGRAGAHAEFQVGRERRVAQCLGAVSVARESACL